MGLTTECFQALVRSLFLWDGANPRPRIHEPRAFHSPLYFLSSLCFLIMAGSSSPPGTRSTDDLRSTMRLLPPERGVPVTCLANKCRGCREQRHQATMAQVPSGACFCLRIYGVRPRRWWPRLVWLLQQDWPVPGLHGGRHGAYAFRCHPGYGQQVCPAQVRQLRSLHELMK